jgi:hypothetical protein
MNKKTFNFVLLYSLLCLSFVATYVHAQDATISSIITAIKNSLSGIGTALATIGFMVAGIMYIASTAKPELMNHAKQALVAGVVGIVILLLAPLAEQFVKTIIGIR